MINFNYFLGFYSLALKWAPSITYLHRRLIFLKNIKKFKNFKNILEIGSGSGSILAEINRVYPKIKTYSMEHSHKAKQMINHFSPKSMLIENFKKSKKKYDAIIFLEVMEHVKDDNIFLKNIYKNLNKNGLIFLSVPAHKNKWSIIDIWAGHYRRYEKNQLINFLTENNFKIQTINSYGYPICNFAHFVSRFFKKNKIQTKKKRSVLNQESGIDRNIEFLIFKIVKIFPLSYIIHIICYTQLLFYKLDLGIGYFVIAQKKGN